MLYIPKNAALLVIDVQDGFADPRWGSRNNPEAEDVIAALLGVWRDSHRPVFYVQHLSDVEDFPLSAGSAGCQIKQVVRPREDEMIFTKRVNSAFIGTKLEETLRHLGIDTLVLTGLTTPHCVSTSARMAGNLGFNVYLPRDAIAAFAITGPDGKQYSAEEIHTMSLATLHQEFATVIDSEQLLNTVEQNHRLRLLSQLL